MTKQEYDEKIKELQKQLDELKNVKIEEKQKKWKPAVGETYFCVGGDGDVTFYEFDECIFDAKFIKLGNCFKTKEEAQYVADKIKYTQMFKQYVEKHSDLIDWENENQMKWHTYYDFTGNRIDYEWGSTFKWQGIIYASSKQILQDAVAYVGEDNVKKYLLGVEE